MVHRVPSRLLPCCVLALCCVQSVCSPLLTRADTDPPSGLTVPQEQVPAAAPDRLPVSAGPVSGKSPAIPYPDEEGIPDRLILPDRRPAAVPELRGDALPVVRPMGGPAGEYTTQQALLLAWVPENDDARPVQIEIARHVCATTQVIVVAPNADGVEAARLAFQGAAVTDENITFVESPIDTPWVRDYGPFAVRTGTGQIQLIDSPYGTDRLQDDNLPGQLAKLFELPVAETSLIVEGGNLLSNGDGLLVGSTNLIGENQDHGFTLKEIKSRLLGQWHAREVVFVDPIAGEPTGHVDMLMTFPAKDTVIVADYAEDASDPFNRQLLNETAERLASVQLVDGRALNVVRIPMPPPIDVEAWPTYCNVVYANGVLLVPYFPEHRESFHAAVMVYRQVLPGWRILGVDCSTIIKTGGALHCLTATIPADRSLNEKPLFRGRRVVRAPADAAQQRDGAKPWRPPVTN